MVSNGSISIVWSFLCDHSSAGGRSSQIQVCVISAVLAFAGGILALLTICGNLFILLAVIFNSKLRRKHTSVLICNLAFADLLVGIFVMPFAAANLFTGSKWIYGSIVCRLWISLDVICCTASIATLCVISVDRFIGVTQPLQYPCIVTRRRTLLSCIGVWFFSVAVLLGTLRWTGRRKRETFQCYVGDELQHVTHSIVLSFFLPLVIILAVYLKIYWVTRKRERSLLRNLDTKFNLLGGRNRRPTATATAPAPPASRKEDSDEEEDDESTIEASPAPERRQTATSSLSLSVSTNRSPLVGQTEKVVRDGACSTPTTAGGQQRQSFMIFPLRIHYGGVSNDGSAPVNKQRKFYSKHKKSAMTLGVIVGAFLVCWLPFFALYLINHLFGGEIIPPILLDIFTWMGYANSALNPIIYGLTMRTFKQAFGHMLRHNILRQSRLQWNKLQQSFRGKLFRRSPDASSVVDIVDEFSTSTNQPANNNNNNSKKVNTTTGQHSPHTTTTTTSNSLTVGAPSKLKSLKTCGEQKALNSRQHKQQVDKNLRFSQPTGVGRSSSWMNLKLYRMLVSTEVSDL